MNIFMRKTLINCVNIDNIAEIYLFDKVCMQKLSFDSTHKHLLWLAPTKADVLELLEASCRGALKELSSLTIAVKDVKKMSSLIKERFYVVKAAGGIVQKKDKLLLIYKKGLWDLPKGKRKRGEEAKETAKREVEEECNIRIEVMSKIGVTYHLLSAKQGTYGLKKTVWYHMKLLEDKDISPFTEEGIEDLGWYTLQEAEAQLRGSYASIQYIVQQWRWQIFATNP